MAAIQGATLLPRLGALDRLETLDDISTRLAQLILGLQVLTGRNTLDDLFRTVHIKILIPNTLYKDEQTLVYYSSMGHLLPA